MPKSPRSIQSKSRRKTFRTPALRRAVCWEGLENRRLLSSDWLLNGTTLTETINGTAQPSTTVSASSTTITAVGADSITVENYGGSVSVVGGGGGDTLTVYAGTGGTVSFTDTGASSADQLVVRAPATSAANFTASSGSISLSTGDSITYDSSVTTVSLIGQLFSNGDALTINGSGSHTIAVGANSVSLGGSAPVMFYSTFNGLTVNGGASDNLTVNGDSIPTTLNAGTGNDTFTITTNSVALSLNGGSGTDTYNINSNSGLLIATGGSGDSTFNIAGSSSSMTLNGGSANNTYTVQSNSATLNINGGGLTNSLTVNGNSSTLIARGGTGSVDGYTINATTGSVTITGGSGSSTYLVSAPTVAAVNIVGNVSGTGALTFDGTPLNNAFSITANTLSAGSGATVGFTHMTSLAVNGIGGNDSFLINGDSTPTTLNGAAGNDTFNIQSISAGLNINTGTGASTINLGSNAPLTTNNKVNLLTGAIAVNGDGSDTLNFNDAADTAARTATLTSTTLTGVGTGGLTYSGLAALNLKLGSGGNTIAINSTAAGTITNFNTGSGTNTLYLGSTNSGSLGGVMSGFVGALNLNGGTQNALVIDDSGDATPQTVTLTSTQLTGLSPAAISYTGASALTIDLGTGGNTLGVNNTAAATSVTINGGTGNDSFTVVSDSSPLAINTNGGADTVNIQTIAGATTVTSTGGSTINVGNSGVLAGISALLTVTGGGTDTLTADDSADAAISSGSLSATTIAGFGMTSGIGYSGIASLFLNLGTKANTLAITGTAAATSTHVAGGAGGNSINMTNDAGLTTIAGGSGSDSITIQNDSAATSIQSGNGNDTITVQSAAAATTITTGNGNDTIAAQNTLASINITAGNGNDTISLQNASGVSTILAGNGNDVISLQNASAASSITAGNGNDTVTLQSESATTTIQVGNGSDIVNVQAMSVAASVSTGTGADIINVGNNVPATPSSTASITATLTLNGGGNTQLNVDDTGDSTARTVGFTSTAITGISGGSGILYSGMNGLTLSLGSGGNTVTVTSTASTVPTTILTGTGSDTVNVLSTSSATHISVGTGTNTINVGSTGATSGSLMTSISGALTLIGNSSNDTLKLLDAADSLPRVGTLSTTQLTGFSPATIAFSHFGSTTIWMGTANNALTIANTATGSTTINGGIGNDSVTINADTGPLTVNTNGGADTLNVQTINGATTLNSGGSSAINVGNTGVLAGIAALLTVNGSGTDTLTADDSADAAASTGTLSATAITGLNMSTGISYSGLAALNLKLGAQANTLTISNTAAATATVVTGGASADTISLQNDSGVTTITSGNGNDTINIQATTAATSIATGTGTDTVNVSSNSLTTAPIAATLTITGGNATQLNVTDTADVTARTVALSPTTLTGITGGSGISYSGLSGLNLGLGSGGNTLTISNTAAITNTIDTGTGSDVVNVQNASGTTTINTNNGNDTVTVTTTTGITNLNTGAGNDTISILATGAQTNINTGTGTNVVNVGSTGATSGSLLTSISGPLNLTGNSDTLNLLDAADATGRTGTLTATQLTGFSPATISYTNFGSVNLWTGTVGNTITIANTATATTTINAGTATNAITVQNTTGPLTVNAGNSMIGVQNISSATTITATAADHIAVGGQTLAGINAALTINGVTGSNVLIDDSADAIARTATLGNGILTGLSTGAINYTNLATLAINLGAASNTLSVNDTTSFTPTTVTGGTGNDTLNILADSATLTLSPAGGNNTVNITNNGLLSGIGSAITLNSTGTDTLNVDNSADTTVRSNAIISSATISGLGGAAINYTGITTLNVKTGNAANTLAIPSTANGVTTSLHTGAAGNILNISTTTGPLALSSGGADTVNIGNSGLLSGIAGNVSVAGNDTLNLADTADHTNAIATLSSTSVTGLGAAGVISYSGLSALNLNLGTGNDTVHVTGTSAGHTTINSGGGSNAITITTTTTPLAITSGGTISVGTGTIANLTGHVTLTGTGSDQLNLNDTADTTARTGSLSATQLTLGPANIAYTGVGGVTIGLGSGGNTFGIAGTSSPVTLNGGSGADSLSINAISAATTINTGSNSATISVGNLLSRLTGPLMIHGSGSNPLTISDAADTSPQTGSLTSGLLNGFSSGIIFYDGISSIGFTLGTGGSGLSMLSHAVPVTVHAGGTDAITVYGSDTQLDGFTAPTTIAGNGSTALKLDASAVTSAMSVTLDSSTVNGMGDSAVSYSNLGSLNLLLGSGHNSLTVNGTSAAPTAITSSSAGTSFDLTTSNITGPLQLTGSGSDSLIVDDSANNTGRNITLAAGQLTGLGGAISYTGMSTLGINLGSGNDTANITAIDPAVPTRIDGGAGTNTASINIAGDFAGTLALTRFQTGSLNVGGNFTGSLTDDGSFAAVRIRGNFNSGAVLNVEGEIDQLEVDGKESGQLTVGSLLGVVEPTVTPSSDGTIFSLTQQGITRSIQIETGSTPVDLPGVTFSVVYDATTGQPQAAIRVNGDAGQQRFDVLLNAPVNSNFSLSRIDSGNDTATDVRNVVVNGDILNSVTQNEANYFGYTRGIGGGVYLPNDSLAAVSARDNIYFASVRAKSLQGLAFSTLVGSQGDLHPGGLIPVSDFKEKLLLSILEVNPVTNKPFAAVLPPTETLMSAAGTAAEKTGLFAGKYKTLPFDPNGVVLYNHDGTGEATVGLTFGTKTIAGELPINLLDWQGTGGSVQTKRIVSNITSSGALGDVFLGAGKAEVLQSITAPSIEGSINLYGGKLIGTIQTTSGDIGQASESTNIALQMMPGSRIISRADLFSDVQVTGNLMGTISAAGNIDGDVSVSGGGRSTGNVIAFGSISGSIQVAGSFAGELASGSAGGITGNISIARGVTKQGVITSQGQIGDVSAGTSLKTSKMLGTVVAIGPVNLQLPKSKHTPVVSGANDAGLLDSLWTDAGAPLSIDGSTGGLAGLTEIETRLRRL